MPDSWGTDYSPGTLGSSSPAARPGGGMSRKIPMISRPDTGVGSPPPGSLRAYVAAAKKSRARLKIKVPKFKNPSVVDRSVFQPPGAIGPPGDLAAILRDILEEERPSAVFSGMFPQMGGRAPYGQFLREQFPRYLDEYFDLAATPERMQDPTFSFANLLRGKDPRAEFNALAPFLRGERSSMFAPRVRFV